MKYLSKIFQPFVSIPKNITTKNDEITSKSQRLLNQLGLVRPTKSSGCFAFLPLGMRSLDKLIKLVESKMDKIDAQKTLLPIFAPEELWSKSGRLDGSEELMKLQDRHNRKYIICPTHEELFTDLISSVSPVSPKDLPIKLYQIGSKFRDEKRPRYGIIRGREFIMKDLYTFDTSEESSKATYNQVCEIYDELFNEIGIPYQKVEASTGAMGGNLSHEYHYTSSIGEDRLLECKACGFKFSSELLPEIISASDSTVPCKSCNSSKGYKTFQAFEVGHTFLLGTRYSEPLSATSTLKSSLHMGCYGLGLSRILGASLETLSSETELKWPRRLAPYTLCVVGPKKGSKEAVVGLPLMDQLCKKILKNCERLTNDSVIDDRDDLTIGKRVMEAKRTGYPFILVIGQKAVSEDPKYELIDTANDHISILNEEEIIHKLQESVNEFMLPSGLKISDDLLTENSVK